MTEKEFDDIVEDTLQTVKNVLVVKAKEYRRNNNPMHNFDIGAEISGKSREEVLDGFMLKHYISYRDMINDVSQGKLPTIEYIDEKVGDIINYMILLKASIVDKISIRETISEGGKFEGRESSSRDSKVLVQKDGVLQ